MIEGDDLSSRNKLTLVGLALFSILAFQNCADQKMSFSEVPAEVTLASSGDSSEPPVFDPTSPGTTTNIKIKFEASYCNAGDICTVYLSLSATPKSPIAFDFATDDGAFAAGQSSAQPNVDYKPYAGKVTLTGTAKVAVKIQTFKRANAISEYKISIPVTMNNCHYPAYGNSNFSCSSLQ